MTEISATKDSVAQQAGRDSVVNYDDRVTYTDCPIVITVNIQGGGIMLAIILPCLILLFLFAIHHSFIIPTEAASTQAAAREFYHLPISGAPVSDG